MGLARKDSDVDFAVVMKDKKRLQKSLQLHGDLYALLSKSITRNDSGFGWKIRRAVISRPSYSAGLHQTSVFLRGLFNHIERMDRIFVLISAHNERFAGPHGSIRVT